MTQQNKSTFVIFLCSLVVLSFLLLQGFPPLTTMEQWVLGALFGGLLLFVTHFGVVEGNVLVSLLPLTAVSGYLMLDKVTISWLLWFVLLIHGGFRLTQWHRENKEWQWPPARLIQAILLNMIIHVTSLELGGILYEAAGGNLPLISLSNRTLIPLLLLSVGYIASNHIFFIFLLWLSNQALPSAYLKQVSRIIIYELTPLIFSPLFPLIYQLNEVSPFILLIIGYILIVLGCFRLGRLHRRLNGRIDELNLLHSASESLGSTLSLTGIGWRLFELLSNIIPIDHFLFALVDDGTNKVTYVTVVENGKRASEPTNPIMRRITEWVWAEKRPLYLSQPTAEDLSPLKLPHNVTLFGHWTGIPIQANGHTHGVLAIHSRAGARQFLSQDNNLLETITSQVGLTISNALLYNKTDEQLSQSLQELRSILATTNDGILLLGKNTNILMKNRAFELLLETANNSIQSSPLLQQPALLEQLGFSDKDWEAVSEKAANKVNGAKEKITIHSLPIERTLMPVKSPLGDISGWLLILRDISEEVSLNQLREDMIHMLVHDLRSPLNSVITGITASQWQIGRNNFTPLPRLLQHAYDGSYQMLNLINQLLEIYRIEGEFISLTKAKIDPASLFAELVERYSGQLEDAKITLRLDIDTQGRPPIFADKLYMDRVWDNLLDNAIKFTPDNGRIRLFAFPDPNHEAQVVLGIEDSGDGIQPDEQDDLFEKFIYGTNKYSRRKGSGLGLAYCRLAIEAHGGKIWVESSGFPGEGTTFYIQLETAPELEKAPL